MLAAIVAQAVRVIRCLAQAPSYFITQDFAATQPDLEELTRSDRSSLRLTRNDELVDPLEAKVQYQAGAGGRGRGRGGVRDAAAACGSSG
jgi:hypothetical protein